MAIVKFPANEPDHAEITRRLNAEVERLSHQPDWLYWVEREDHVQQYGVKPATLKAMVAAKVKANERKAKEARDEQQRVEARAERDRREQQRKQEAEAKAAEKAEEAKRKEREKGLAAIAKLPSAEREARLAELADRLGGTTPCFIEDLREELLHFLEVPPEEKDILEPWPEPVDTAALLNDVTALLRRYIVIHDDDAMVAVVLWTAFVWLHGIALYSPLLVISGAGENVAKTLLCGLLRRLTPNAYAAAELTGPNLYRFVDQVHPTLIMDDADKLLERRPELVHIINVSWTRDSARIPRQERSSSGQWVTRWFDAFCPKVIAGINVRMPKATASRTIRVTMLPKLPHEKVEPFKYEDNEELQNLRCKFLRWAADNAASLRDASPKMPARDFINRQQNNWTLLLAIAELAGGRWPTAARQSAKKLAAQRRDPNDNLNMLAAFFDLFKEHGLMLSSARVTESLTTGKNANSEWSDYRGRGKPITQREISLLLDQYDIHPDVIHPSPGRSDRGYNAAWFETAFRHYLHRELRPRPEPKKK